MNAVANVVPSQRRALLGKVHIGKKALALSDEAYRDILSRQYGVASASELSDALLTDLVEHFKKLGFKPIRKAPARAGKRPLAQSDEQRKIRALWLSLYHLGVISDPSEEALAAFAKRSTGGKTKGVDALQWVSGEGAYKVIEALKAWATRDGGVYWIAYKDRGGNMIGYCDRGRVIEAQWRILRKLDRTFYFVDVLKLEDDEADRIIARQGEEIRRAKAGER
ncbi:MAG: regulatory protein GemA [Parvibaculum sedimenti]|uniref:regulatory protein GemA n=1 Tax=Parvibaculum sedimenti TaxID=2608632 RepID=UPI003BB4D502